VRVGAKKGSNGVGLSFWNIKIIPAATNIITETFKLATVKRYEYLSTQNPVFSFLYSLSKSS